MKISVHRTVYFGLSLQDRFMEMGVFIPFNNIRIEEPG